MFILDICFRVLVFVIYIFWYLLSLATMFILPAPAGFERVFGGHYEHIDGERVWVDCAPFTVSKPFEPFSQLASPYMKFPQDQRK